MSTYSLTGQVPWYKNIFTSIGNKVSSFIEEVKDEVSVHIVVPEDILLTSERICRYISRKTKYKFTLHNLIMFLYIVFLDEAMGKPNCKEAYKILSTVPKWDQTIRISTSNGEVEDIKLFDTKKKLIILTMSTSDAKDGKCLLKELKSRFNLNIDIDQMIYTIWMNFMIAYMNEEKYKKGTTSKVLNEVIKILNNKSL